MAYSINVARSINNSVTTCLPYLVGLPAVAGKLMSFIAAARYVTITIIHFTCLCMFWLSSQTTDVVSVSNVVERGIGYNNVCTYGYLSYVSLVSHAPKRFKISKYFSNSTIQQCF